MMEAARKLTCVFIALYLSICDISLGSDVETKRDVMKASHNVEFKQKHGAPPELVLLDAGNTEVERIDLRPFSQIECQELLRRKGFFKKTDGTEEVPEEYLTGPYVERLDLKDPRQSTKDEL